MLSLREVKKYSSNPDKIITPYLTVQVSETVVSPGDTVIVFGKLGMSKGDVNDDGYIGIDDIVMAAERYGASRGDPNYEPKADVNDDGYIGIDDIVTMAELYGQNAEGKPIELQQLVNDQWIKLQETMTANGGSYSFNVQIPSDFSTPSTIYFRAYFPGGEY